MCNLKVKKLNIFEKIIKKEILIIKNAIFLSGIGGDTLAFTDNPLGGLNLFSRKRFNRGDNFPDGDPCEWNIEQCITEMKTNGVVLYSLGILPSLNPVNIVLKKIQNVLT